VAYFFHALICIDADKNGLGNILGDFYTNTSGRPGNHTSTLKKILLLMVLLMIFVQKN
jgi:hypothetical protein